MNTGTITKHFRKTAFVLFSIIFITAACSKSDDNHPDEPDERFTSGLLYYSAANTLTQFDFSTHRETSVFLEGDTYSISLDGQQFAWYKNDFSEGSTTVHIHDMQSPDNNKTISVPYILRSTPEFVKGQELLGALVESGDEPTIREDLLLFDYQGNIAGRLPRVKDFTFSPGGQDLLISAEALDTNGEVIGYALALIKNFRSTSSSQSITIREFDDYARLPDDLAISPDSEKAAYVFLDHLYTVPLLEGSGHKQITDSRFKETDPTWSPDGSYLLFTANVDGSTQDCGELRIVPSAPDAIIEVPDNGYDNAPVNPLQPVNEQGKVIHSCGSAKIIWHSAG